MTAAPVDPAEVPIFTGDFAQLDLKVKAISAGGAAISTATSDVHSSFGGLSAFYQAPEADQLFATTKPVADLGLKLSSDMCTIAGALGTYARDAEPIAKRLDSLKKEAEAFRTKVASDEHWDRDGDLIDENLERRNRIAEAWGQFQDVERAAHAKIVALVGGTALTKDDGSHGKGMYGYDAEAMKQAKTLPWGEAVEEDIPAWQIWEHAWEFTKGFFVDGVWGTLKGLGGLVGLQGWDTFKQSWTGLAKLATGLAIISIPGAGPLFMAVPDDKLPTWVRDSRTALKETGKALLAWDQWSSNPGRAAGAVTFNVITTIATGGSGSAAAGAGKAGAVAKALSAAGKVGHYVDPMTYVFKGAGASISKIGDVMSAFKGMGKVEVPSINIDNAISLPEGSIHLPDGAIKLPEGTPIPEGATKLPDGNVKLPEGTVELPEGTVKLPGDGEAQFMDPKGHLYDEAGKKLPGEAPKDIADTPKADVPKAETPAPVRVPEMAGVGARGGDDAIRLGSDISDPLHNGGHGGPHGFDNTPTGRAGDHTPGGHAPDNMPRNDLNNGPHGNGPHPDSPTTHGPDGAGGGGTHPDGPGTSGHGDGPGGGSTHPDGAGTGGSHSDIPGGLDDIGHGADDATAPAGQADNAAGSGTPDGEQQLTTERRKELQDEHVRLANEDPAWFQKHYRDDGHRWSKRTKVDGVELPILKKNAEDKWISKYDMPHGPSDIRYNPKPMGTDSVPPAHHGELNTHAANRRVSVDLTNAEKAFKENASAANQEALAAAKEAYDKQLPGVPNNSKIAEALGEKAAELHVVPREFKVVEPIDLPKTANGANMFDAAYRLEDGEYLIVEAKAPKGDLDWRQGRADPEDPANPDVGDNGGAQGMRVKQGTRPYIRTILGEMTARGGADADIAKELRDALKAGKLKYVLVKANEHGSTYAGAKLEHFKY